MLKPRHLVKGDTVAIVSLSAGTLGEPWAIHKLYIAQERLERNYGPEVVTMPNALKGREYLYRHPEARTVDLMEAFQDTRIKAVFSAIGGDTIRLLPHIDFDVIRNNPKIFTGFSDTTSNHFMMYKTGLISYYGASVMTNFAEYGKINDYTAQMIRDTLFEPQPTLEIPSSPYWYDDEDEKIWWKEENIHTLRQYHPEESGGIHSAEELTKTGSKQAVFRLKSQYPNTCVVILYHLEAAIRSIEIKQLDSECKADLKAWFHQL